ncbi:MAG: DUF3102 domain-containing protein [Desulfamplus sp.]|nr:DUF3102 domain-containing protein [Desulfamplus sp.]
MNEIITQEIFDYNLIPATDRDLVKTKTIETKILIKQTSQGIIEIGKNLIELKPIIGHGNWIQWLRAELKWSDGTARKFMQAGAKFGNRSNSNDLDCSKETLFFLAQDDIPESAIEEIIERKEAGETTTTAKAKEVVADHKEIEELKAKLAQKDAQIFTLQETKTYPLLSNIQTLLDNGEIMPAKAKILQGFTPEGQAVWFTDYVAKFSAENRIDEERRKAQIANEKALKAIEEKEEAVRQLQSVSGEDNAQLIAKYEQQIKEIKEENRRRAFQERKDIENQAKELYARVNKEKIEKAEKEKALAEKREKEIRDKANAAWRKNDELTRENKKLQSQFEVDKPENLDNAQAKEMQRLLQQLPYYFERIKTDNRIANGQMENTKKVIIEIIQSWSSLLEEMDSNETIEHIDKVTAIDIN